MKKNYMYTIIAVLIWGTMASIAKKTVFDIPDLEVLTISSFMAVLYLLLLNKIYSYSFPSYVSYSSLRDLPFKKGRQNPWQPYVCYEAK